MHIACLRQKEMVDEARRTKPRPHGMKTDHNQTTLWRPLVNTSRKDQG